MRKVRLLVLVLALFLAILAATSYSARAATQSSGGSHFVRIPTTAQADFSRLRLSPTISLAYDSFLWLELNDTDLATLAASGIPFTAVPEAGQVQIVAYRFDPISEGEPTIAPAMRADASQAGFHLIQFNGPVRSEWLRVLEANGLPMLQYYPHNAYLTWGSATAVASTANLSFVRWQGAVHPAYKVDPNLDGFNGRIHNVDIMFYNDGNIDATLSALKAMGATVLQHYPSQPDKAFYDAIVEIDANALTAVAQLNTVLWLGYLGPAPILDDEMSSQIIAGNHPGGTPVTGYNAHLAALGVDGTGVTWAIIDTGVDYDHPDLNTHIVGGYEFPGSCNTGNPGDDCAAGGHGTHVAGIVGGTGVGDAGGPYTDPNGFLYGLGVAPGYGIFAMNSLSAPSWPPAGGWQEHSKRAVLGGAIGGNNSWTTGEGTNHGYQASERTHDIMVRDGNFDTASVAEPFIEVFSAGNSGPGPNTLTAPKEGKNLIVVASSLNFRAGNINTISSFSSRGPAADGRWVPTITTPGEQIASTRNNTGGSCSTPIGGTNNLYAFCSGTSMAAPHASGAIALFTEWWRGFNSGADPSPAMAKALVVNSAIDMGTADIPNANEGWGRINITNIISPSVLFVYRDQVDMFTATGQQLVLNLGVADPTKPVRITLAWSDAPGAVGANPALVNNLNLTVVNNSNTYRGNVFSGGWSTTGGSYDNINNLENVYIQNPGGDLTITIDAANIAGDGVPYNGQPTDQDFALICQNCAGGADFTLSVTPPTQSVCAGPDVLYNVNVGSILGFVDDVTLSASGHPAGTTADFSVNPVTPPGSSVLTIGNTGAAAGGSYAISVVGVAPT
ncbi:MAG: S8 family serine peptidase, partial [Anaerolineae bacterium]|nr:S8 family serine peptidase [Anaerolineae bacterium]